MNPNLTRKENHLKRRILAKSQTLDAKFSKGKLNSRKKSHLICEICSLEEILERENSNFERDAEVDGHLKIEKAKKKKKKVRKQKK